MTRHISRTPLWPVLSLAVAVAGCSGSNDDSPSDLQNDPARPEGMTAPGIGSQPGSTVQPDDTASPEPTVPPDEPSPQQGPMEGPVAVEGSQNPGIGPETNAPVDPIEEPDPVMSAGDDDVPEAARARLDSVFRTANGDALQEVIDVLDRLGSRDEIALPALREYFVDELFTGFTEYACADGGTFAVGVRSVSQQGNVYSTIATDCVIGPATINGTFVDSDSFGRSAELRFGRTIDVNDYRLVDARRGLTATIESGQINVFGRSDGDAGRRITGLDWSASGLSVTGADGGYSARSQESSTRANIGETVEAPPGFSTTIVGLTDESGGPEARVDTVERFVRAEGGEQFDSGSLSITSGGGTDTLDAASGNPTTFLYTVDADGVTTTYTIAWSERYGFEAIDPDGGSGLTFRSDTHSRTSSTERPEPPSMHRTLRSAAAAPG